MGFAKVENGFHVKSEYERITVTGALCSENLELDQNFTSSFSRLRQRYFFKCVPHVQHDYIS